MGKKILILGVVLLMAGLYLLVQRSGTDYRAMQKGDQALLPYGAKMAVSADCEHWLTGDDSRVGFAAKSLVPSATKFNFARLSLPIVGDMLIALDARPDDLLALTGKEQIWVSGRDGRVVNMSTGGYFGVTPKTGAPAEGAASAVALFIAIGHNMERNVSLAGSGGEVYFMQHAGKDILICTVSKGCNFFRDKSKVSDPADITALKKTWDRSGMNDVGAVCKSLGDAATRDALNRYDAIDGACHGQVDMKALKASYQDRVADCAAYTGKVAPQAEAFFAMP